MRILVAEAKHRRVGISRLLEQEGFEVETARGGAGFLETVEAAPHDLVLLDLDFTPDCLPLLGRLARAHPALPIVVVSTRTDLPTKLRCFELGALDYLVKPYAPEELGARIRAHLRISGGSGGVLSAGRLALDVTARQARIGRKVVDLTEREFQLLNCFVRNAGEVVTREQLLAEVWGRTPDSCSNVVDVCVLRLRKKLRPTVPITTVRRLGYRLSVDANQPRTPRRVATHRPAKRRGDPGQPSTSPRLNAAEQGCRRRVGM
jgi:DNA-binding response OmpR family regulator